MVKRILKAYGLALVLGLLIGLLGAYFQLSIEFIHANLEYVFGLIHRPVYLTAILSGFISSSFVLIAFYLVLTYAPEASGSGVPEIQGALTGVRPINWRLLIPVKFIGGALALGAHMVLGREGPTIQMGGNLGAMLAHLGHLKIGRKRTLIAAGAAAGLATAFNAPLAGILFVIEEMRNEFNFSFTNFKMVAIATASATLMSQIILGSHSAVVMPIFIAPLLEDLGWFFFLGLFIGVIGLLFNHLLIFGLNLGDKLTFKQRLLYVGSMGFIVGVLYIYFPLQVGDGFFLLNNLSLIPTSLQAILVLSSIRFIMLVLCYCTGVPGGIFAPLLSIGMLLGAFFGLALHSCHYGLTISPGVFSVVAMGCLFAASIRSPLTGIVLIVEMTQNYSLIFPLLVSCLTSTTVVQLAHNQPIYTQLLRRLLQRKSVKQG